MAHTPGPWKFDEPDNWYGLQARVCTDDFKPIAQVQLSGWPKKVGLSNAALCAAAPELLAALEKIAIAPCNCASDGLPGDECASCIARLAIAKPKGA